MSRFFCKICGKRVIDERKPKDLIGRHYYVYYCEVCDDYSLFLKRG